MSKKENRFTAKLEKFKKKGEKSGWTYIAIPASMAEVINAGVKKSFRVKGSIDLVKIKQVALLPIGGGEFILPINQKIKKELKKDVGDKVTLILLLDNETFKLSEDLMSCLQNEPDAHQQFKKLAPSHQRYFSKWIEEAKTIATKEKRILLTLEALGNKKTFGEMLREQKEIK